MKNSVLFPLLLINLTGCVGYTYSKDSDVVVSNVMSPAELQFSTKPKRIADKINPDGSEMYVVKDGLKWCGLTIWAIVPVPLWMPGCRVHTEVTYKGGTPTRVENRLSNISGRLCGPIFPFAKVDLMPLMKIDDAGPTGFCPAINVKAP
jgi:hypothetical protein